MILLDLLPAERAVLLPDRYTQRLSEALSLPGWSHMLEGG